MAQLRLRIILLTLAALFGAVRAGSLVLDPTYEYTVDWRIRFDIEELQLNVSVKTTNYIGLGLAYTNSMYEADIIIGGVRSDGTAYIEDRTGLGPFGPPLDVQQDYRLISASENATHTRLQIVRALYTNDTQDYDINANRTTYFIWAVGSSDNVGYHGPYRGGVEVNLLANP